MIAACQNAWESPVVPKFFHGCPFIGEVQSLESECPRCHNKGRLVAVDEAQ